MAIAERRAEIVWQGELQTGSGRLSVGSKAFPDQEMSFGARTGDQAQRTNPEELIAAAHATCYAMAFSNALKQADAPPQELRVTAVCALDRVEGALKITTMELSVLGRVPGIDQAKFEEVAKQAEARCPVSNALRGNVEIRLHAKLNA